MKKIKVDLHDIHNKSEAIEKALEEGVEEAVSTRTKVLEIIPGKGTGQLKKRVLKFLERKDIRSQYHRIDKDRDNSGRIFVRFKF